MPRYLAAVAAIVTLLAVAGACDGGAGPDGFDNDELRRQFALVPLGPVPQPPEGAAPAERVGVVVSPAQLCAGFRCRQLSGSAR